jgi:hemerythrin-like domain-containing protein
MNNTKRYNVFKNIHKGLRTMLFSTQMKWQQTDFTSPEAASMVANLETVLYYYDQHAGHEDHFILSKIIQQEPQIAAALEGDHVVDHELSQNLRSLLNRWKDSSTNEARESTAAAVFYALNEFIAFNLYHMNKEETILLPLLWKHFSDAEILGMQDNIVASINPEILIEESRWMMRSISDTEIQEWLGGVKMSAPDFVYNTFMQMAAEELPAERFIALQIS